jgi:hypothetical protein
MKIFTLHNEEFHNLYISHKIIRLFKSKRMRLVEHVAHTREIRNAQKMLVGKYEGKNPLERYRRIWENNIRIDLREIGW